MGITRGIQEAQGSVSDRSDQSRASGGKAPGVGSLRSPWNSSGNHFSIWCTFATVTQEVAVMNRDHPGRG